VTLGGGVAVCLLLSAYRAVIFAIAQLVYINHSCKRAYAVSSAVCIPSYYRPESNRQSDKLFRAAILPHASFSP